MKGDILASALAYSEKGFSIIPILAGDKRPAISSWKVFQSRRPLKEELNSWFGNGRLHNIAIVTGAISGLVVVDLDSQEAVDWAKANGLYGQTPMQRTGKGYHLFFRYKEGVRNFQKREDLPNIDLRGDGGYVVVAPSTHPSGAKYEWVEGYGLNDLPLAELPEVVLKRTEQKSNLQELYKGVEKGDRNNSLTRLCGSWVKDGLSYEECLQMAITWNGKNSPPLPLGEVERTVNSIWERHKRENTEVNIMNALIKWDNLEIIDVNDAFIIEGAMPEGAITLLFGRGGIGKTSLALQMAYSIAEGIPFFGLSTKKTHVSYIDLENPISVLKDRKKFLGNSDNILVWHGICNPPPPKIDKAESIRYAELPKGLLVFDTLRASFMGDENSSKDITLVIDRLKQLRDKGYTILLLHHTPKGDSGIYKGSTAILDLVDHAICLETVNDVEIDDFDPDRLFRLGTRLKTRYEPFHIHLKFNPDIKGFIKAEDPTEQILTGIYNILKVRGPMKATDLCNAATEELGLKNRNKVFSLLKKGIGRFWNSTNEGRTVCYSIIVSPYTPKIDTIAKKPVSSTNTSNIAQSLDNTTSYHSIEVAKYYDTIAKKPVSSMSEKNSGVDTNQHDSSSVGIGDPKSLPFSFPKVQRWGYEVNNDVAKYFALKPFATASHSFRKYEPVTMESQKEIDKLLAWGCIGTIKEVQKTHEAFLEGISKQFDKLPKDKKEKLINLALEVYKTDNIKLFMDTLLPLEIKFNEAIKEAV